MSFKQSRHVGTWHHSVTAGAHRPELAKIPDPKDAFFVHAFLLVQCLKSQAE
jgi:hypothetical protein